MPLAHDDLREIDNHIKEHLPSWLAELHINTTNVSYELEIRERTVRIEEELKHQRDLMLQGFEMMDKRFEQVEKRFEQVDKRFEQVEKRFEQVDRRFEQVDKRFEQVDKRFEQVDRRFEQVDKRFEAMTTRIDRFMIWSFATMLTLAGVVIAAIKFL